MIIGEIIKQAITDSGFSTVAEFARHAGINESVVYSHINGSKSPTWEMLGRYAVGLGRVLVIEFKEV